ncbi:hypothetical protein C0Q70_19914 [Pomacea canaliculata]|uniref:Secreted protein n=1 Tax=Pomacea canaliculata TaxID=400727 RepID=A0A2T7NE45_POMCA|nr:hypothetical protein C0Q70_19914 [Pomacea canaliculata]
MHNGQPSAASLLPTALVSVSACVSQGLIMTHLLQQPLGDAIYIVLSTSKSAARKRGGCSPEKNDNMQLITGIKYERKGGREKVSAIT